VPWDDHYAKFISILRGWAESDSRSHGRKI
jgi:hypothetical protein